MPHAHDKGECCLLDHSQHNHDHDHEPKPSEEELEIARVTQKIGELETFKTNTNESLLAKFTRAEELFQKIDGALPGYSGADVSKVVPEAVNLFMDCSRMIRLEGLFSDNEFIEDINTESLKFLLVDYYIANLKTKLQESRFENLKAAKSIYELYIQNIIKLGVITSAESKALGLLSDEPLTGNALRAAKIERMKRNKEAKNRLELLSKATRIEAIAEAQGGLADGVGSNTQGPDEEQRREMALLALEITVRQAADEIGMINQELPLLEHRAKLRAEHSAQSDVHADPRMRAREIERERMSPEEYTRAGPLPDDPSVNPNRKGIEIARINPTFDVEREHVKAGIFQYGHRLPTMAMEDWGDIVLQKTRDREKREMEQSKDRVIGLDELRKTGQEDNTDLYDKAQAKQRAFDDWADGVPKGSGVTKRI